jgi:hypothetical protein
MEWVCYYYSDQGEYMFEGLYDPSGSRVDIPSKEFVDEKGKEFYPNYDGLCDAIYEYVQSADHSDTITDCYGRFCFDFTVGELRRLSDAYMPEPELQEDPLRTPQVVALGDMSLSLTTGPYKRRVEVEEWSDLTGEERAAWERWAEFAGNVYGERATFMDITWENAEAEIPSQAYAYDDSRAVMLYVFDTPFWEDFRETDGSVDINRANKIALMYARTLPPVHGFANIKEMKKRDIRVEQHIIDPSSGDEITVVLEERGDVRAAQGDESDNDEVSF